MSLSRSEERKEGSYDWTGQLKEELAIIRKQMEELRSNNQLFIDQKLATATAFPVISDTSGVDVAPVGSKKGSLPI